MIRLITIFLLLIFSISAVADFGKDMSVFNKSEAIQSLMASNQFGDNLPCQADCDSGQPHHCVGCFHFILFNNKPSDIGSTHQTKLMSIKVTFLYKSPFLDSLKRPPLAA